MAPDRRTFLAGIAGAGALAAVSGPRAAAATAPGAVDPGARVRGADPDASPRWATPARLPSVADRFDPWLELDSVALAHNVRAVSRLSRGRPILAVIKNNAYGLGLLEAARLLSGHEAVTGFAVVKPEDALALREAGLGGMVLLMGMAPDEAVPDLVEAGVHLSFYLDDDVHRLPALARGRGPVVGHVYLDTGMSRMGMPYHRALPWLEALAGTRDLRVDGAFTAFTEDADFDREQLARFRRTTLEARGLGIELGRLHAASSNGVYHLSDAHLDAVRPGIALFGGYPTRPDEERAKAELRPAVSLRCRVVRVERLRAGDGVSYGRSYVADRPTWIATLPAGHADGYPRGAVKGARVAIGRATYPVIGAVSASHVIVELGERRSAEVGDVATLLGGGPPEVHPNEVARASEASVYDVFMHLNPSLPRVVV